MFQTYDFMFGLLPTSESRPDIVDEGGSPDPPTERDEKVIEI